MPVSIILRDIKNGKKIMQSRADDIVILTLNPLPASHKVREKNETGRESRMDKFDPCQFSAWALRSNGELKRKDEEEDKKTERKKEAEASVVKKRVHEYFKHHADRCTHSHTHTHTHTQTHTQTHTHIYIHTEFTHSVYPLSLSSEDYGTHHGWKRGEYFLLRKVPCAVWSYMRGA